MKVLLISYFTSEKIVIHSVMTCPKAHSNTELEMHWNQLQMTPCEPIYLDEQIYTSEESAVRDQNGAGGGGGQRGGDRNKGCIFPWKGVCQQSKTNVS